MLKTRTATETNRNYQFQDVDIKGSKPFEYRLMEDQVDEDGVVINPKGKLIPTGKFKVILADGSDFISPIEPKSTGIHTVCYVDGEYNGKPVQFIDSLLKVN